MCAAVWKRRCWRCAPPDATPRSKLVAVVNRVTGVGEYFGFMLEFHAVFKYKKILGMPVGLIPIWTRQSSGRWPRR